jgi:ribosomal protein L32
MDRTWTLEGGAREQVKAVSAAGVWRCSSCFGCAETPQRVCPYCGAKQPMRTIRLARGGMREYVEQDPVILAAAQHAKEERKKRADLHRRVTGILIRSKRWPGGRAGAEAKRIIAQCGGDPGAVMKQVSMLTGGA